MLAHECLGLLMILKREIFDQKIKYLLDIIEAELDYKKKSELVIISLKCIFDSLMVHGFM